jgi:undecaprenyl-diphosphatase
MGIEAPIFFDAMVHLGTLLVVLWIFRQDVWNVLRGFFEILRDITKGVPFKDTLREDEHHFAFLIIIGTIPTAIIGLTFRSQLEGLYTNLLAVGIALLFTGSLLFFTSRMAPAERHGIKDMKTIEALIIGMMQGIAIIPGVSRSGSTIAAGMYAGLNKELVTRYSFLLFIPAILGATILQTHSVISDGREIDWIPTLIGTLTAMIVGYFAIHILLKVIRESKFHLFAYYCWAVGLAVCGYVLAG